MSVPRQFARFVLVGAFATALHYAMLVALVEGLHLAPVVGSSIGFATSALCNYLLNRRFTFRSHRRHGEAAPRFVAVALTGFALNALVVWLAFDVGGLHYLAAQVLATLATLAWNFAAHRHWTFRRPS